METRKMHILVLTTWILLVGSDASQSTSCQSEWFGSRCQYKCHCAPSYCTTDNGCESTVPCDNGWFGSACQYVDFAYGRAFYTSSQLSSITDGNDTTCVSSLSNDNVTISLNGSFHFTWLRVRVSNPAVFGKLMILFGPEPSSSCNKQKISIVDSLTTDVHCELNRTMNSVTISGPSVQYLCSVYISGGRNVALKQNVTQSDTYREISPKTGNMLISYSAEKAVDGNTSGDFYKDATCAHTNTNTNPSLNLTLSTLQHVTRYVLYNREGPYTYRLRNFQLRSYSQGLTEVFSYRDPGSATLAKYTLTPDIVTSPIYLVTVTLSNNFLIDNFLTLCEFEIYGDSACEPGKYGRECEHTCNCAGGEPCFVSTGGCPSGCAVGFQGDNCSISCDLETFGTGCLAKCSDFCVKNRNGVRSCDRFNGTCHLGCQPGYQGYMCMNKCDKESYGLGCQFSCSQFCVRGNYTTCDNVDGTCLQGCQIGYQGATCNEKCYRESYGLGCQFSCSQFCARKICDHVDGTCLLGCQSGYQGSTCNEKRIQESTPLTFTLQELQRRCYKNHIFKTEVMNTVTYSTWRNKFTCSCGDHTRMLLTEGVH